MDGAPASHVRCPTQAAAQAAAEVMDHVAALLGLGLGSEPNPNPNPNAAEVMDHVAAARSYSPCVATQERGAMEQIGTAASESSSTSYYVRAWFAALGDVLLAKMSNAGEKRAPGAAGMRGRGSPSWRKLQRGTRPEVDEPVRALPQAVT